MNQFGWCRGIGDASLLQQLGFDYIECGLTSLQLEDEAQHKLELPKYIGSPLPVRAFNGFFPGDLKLVGPEANEHRIRTYLSRAVEALHKIGASIAVLGSGTARHIPDGWDAGRAEEQMLHVLNWAAMEIGDADLIIAIEPLNRRETNLIHSVDEAVVYAKQINNSSIRVLADFYHMDEEEEPLSVLTQHRDWIAHIHIADTGRKSPGTGHYPYEQFAENLKNAGYAGMISAECSVSNPETELQASLAFMKNLFQSYN